MGMDCRVLLTIYVGFYLVCAVSLLCGHVLHFCSFVAVGAG